MSKVDVAAMLDGMREQLARDGTVAYKGGVGPVFFRPKEWEEAIEAWLESE